MKELLENLLAEKDWRIYDYDDNTYDLENWSNARENVIISLSGTNLSELAADAYSAWNNFDAEEHAAEIFIAKRCGDERQRNFYAAAPDSLKELLCDANNIKDMYEWVFKTLNNYVCNNKKGETK